MFKKEVDFLEDSQSEQFKKLWLDG